MNRLLVSCVLALAFALPLEAQTKPAAKTEKDIDPLALRVVKAATDPIKDAKAFTFRALVSRELEGSNNQIITVFSISEITIERPNKMHIKFRGRGEPVELFYDGSGKTVLYSPSAKLYTTVSSPGTIDAALDDAAKHGVFVAVRNFLGTDPYQSLTDDLTTAYVVGRVTLFDTEVHQLAFTEPGAEWQMWVVGGEKPVIRRLQVIDQGKPFHPRICVDFLDWDFSPSVSDDMFTFTKPADAHEIDMLKTTAEK